MRVTKLGAGTYLLGDAVDPVGTTVIYSPAAWTLNTDTDDDLVADTNLGFAAANQYNNFRPRHSRGGVFVFADGSARRVALLDWVLNQDKLWGP
jgi:prepilin-type processing-associated H-X9-DG protein